MLVDLCRRLHVQLAPGGLLGKGIHGIHRTILGKHIAIRIRHLFGKGRHEPSMGGRDLGLDGLRRGNVAAEERMAARTLSVIAKSSVVGC